MRSGPFEPQGRRWWGPAPAAVTVTRGPEPRPQPADVVEARLRAALGGFPPRAAPDERERRAR
jgi:hypothetical protein